MPAHLLRCSAAGLGLLALLLAGCSDDTERDAGRPDALVDLPGDAADDLAADLQPEQQASDLPPDSASDGAGGDAAGGDAAGDGAAGDDAAGDGAAGDDATGDTSQDQQPDGVSALAHHWSRRFGDSSDDRGWGAAVDGSGNVYVVGYVSGTVSFGGQTFTTSGNNPFVASFDADGAHRWSKVLVCNDMSIANAVAVDAGGNVYLVGEVGGEVDFGGGAVTLPWPHAFVASYDSDGAHRWAELYGADSSWVAANGLALDGSGNVHVAGSFGGTIDFGQGPVNATDGDGFAVSLDSGGSFRWVRTFGGSGNVAASSVAVDGTGNVYLAGWFGDKVSFGGTEHSSAGAEDIFLASYDASQALRWSARYGSAGADSGRAVAVDGDDHVYLAGYFRGGVDFGGGVVNGKSDKDAFVASYTADHAFRWVTRFGGNGLDHASGLTVGGGSVFVVGGFELSAAFQGQGWGPSDGHLSHGGRDIFVAELAAATGTHTWSAAYGAGDYDQGNGVALGPGGEIALTGLFEGSVDFGGGALNSAGYVDVILLHLVR